MSVTGFTLDERDEDLYKDWAKSHRCSLRDNDVFPGTRYVGAAGGADEFRFIPHGIGLCLTIRCHCGAELDLSHPEEW